MTPSKSILTKPGPTAAKHKNVYFRGRGYSVSAALNDDAAVAFVAAPNNLSLVLMCHSVPESSRVLLVNKIKALSPKLPILMLYNGMIRLSQRLTAHCIVGNARGHAGHDRIHYKKRWQLVGCDLPLS